MPLPKRRHSSSRRDKRRTHWKLPEVGLTRCAQCAKMIRPHHVCSYCGFYRGRQVLVVQKDAPSSS